MEMVKTIKLDEHTWIFQEEGVRFFLLEGSEKALLIDSGMMTTNAKDLAEQMTTKPVSLLNTHADGDHLGSVAQFDEFYMSLAEAANYYRHFPGKGPDGVEHYATGEILPIKEGDVIDLGGRELEIIGLSGHTPGSVGVLERANGRFYSGDPIQKAGEIFMFDPRREIHAYILSLKLLEKRADEIKEIYPSHGEYPLGSEAIRICRESAEQILSGEMKGQPIKIFGKDEVMLYDTGYTKFLGDM